MKNNIKEIITTASIIALAIALLNPFGFWMPDMVAMCILAAFLVLAALFASFIIREKSEDERDDVHKGLAGRNAFLAGSFVAILGIAYQGYSHTVDPWLVLTLIAMIAVKMATRIWTDRNL